MGLGEHEIEATCGNDIGATGSCCPAAIENSQYMAGELMEVFGILLSAVLCVLSLVGLVITHCGRQRRSAALAQSRGQGSV